MVFFLLIPLLLGGFAVAIAKSASEALSEDTARIIPTKYSWDDDFDDDFGKSKSFSFREIDEILKDLDEPYMFKTPYVDNVNYSELLEVLEEHKKRIRHLERMLEVYR
jgi:hypothetical protein